MGAGGYFGEINLFWDVCKYRAESVMVLEATHCFVIDRHKVETRETREREKRARQR